MKKLAIILLLLSFSFAAIEIVNIPKGSSTGMIAKQLKEMGIIKSELKFKLIAKLKKKEYGFIAGKFKLETDDSYLGLMNQLQDPENFALIKVTVPEGKNLFQIDDLLVDIGLFEDDAFLNFVTDRKQFIHLLKDIPELYNEPELKRLEGFLFPDTYFFEYDVTPEQVVAIMLKVFKRKVMPVYEKQKLAGTLPKRFGRTLKFYNLISLASIVEGEAVVASERRIISGVFVNRLGKRMILGACPTIHYARSIDGLPKKKDLSYKDTKIDSLYNTYTHDGLPPSPISNPGLSSITAAFNPIKTKYYFFVSKGDGTHHFSKTEREHINWKKKYYAQ